jgi:hypothetical protein
MSLTSNPRLARFCFAATLVNCVYTIKITQYVMQSGIPLIGICPHAACKPDVVIAVKDCRPHALYIVIKLYRVSSPSKQKFLFQHI